MLPLLSLLAPGEGARHLLVNFCAELNARVRHNGGSQQPPEPTLGTLEVQLDAELNHARATVAGVGVIVLAKERAVVARRGLTSRAKSR